jgi:hypothetical protein
MRPLGDDPRHLSWQAVSALAWWRLNRSGESDPPIGHGQDFHGHQRLRLWDVAMGLGGGSVPRTLTVFRPLFAETGDPLVREAIWQRSLDVDRLFNEIRDAREVVAFRPTITVRDAPVPYKRFSMLCKRPRTFICPSSGSAIGKPSPRTPARSGSRSSATLNPRPSSDSNGPSIGPQAGSP